MKKPSKPEYKIIEQNLLTDHTADGDHYIKKQLPNKNSRITANNIGQFRS